jgi:hypothetical protein
MYLQDQNQLSGLFKRKKKVKKAVSADKPVYRLRSGAPYCSPGYKIINPDSRNIRCTPIKQAVLYAGTPYAGTRGGASWRMYGLGEWNPLSQSELQEKVKALTRGAFVKELEQTNLSGFAAMLTEKEFEQAVAYTALSGLKAAFEYGVAPMGEEEFLGELGKNIFAKAAKKVKTAGKKVVKQAKQTVKKIIKKPGAIFTEPTRLVAKAVTRTVLPKKTATKINKQIDKVSNQVAKAMTVASVVGVGAVAAAVGGPALAAAAKPALAAAPAAAVKPAITAAITTAAPAILKQAEFGAVESAFDPGITQAATEIAKEQLSNQGINVESQEAEQALVGAIQQQQAQLAQASGGTTTALAVGIPAIALLFMMMR